jgi:hypothetical protein
MGLSEQDTEFIRLGGLLHDVGKIGFPDAPFASHEKKSKPEIVRKIVKHPVAGSEVLANLDFFTKCLRQKRLRFHLVKAKILESAAFLPPTLSCLTFLSATRILSPINVYPRFLCFVFEPLLRQLLMRYQNRIR